MGSHWVGFPMTQCHVQERVLVMNEESKWYCCFNCTKSFEITIWTQIPSEWLSKWCNFLRLQNHWLPRWKSNTQRTVVAFDRDLIEEHYPLNWMAEASRDYQSPPAWTIALDQCHKLLEMYFAICSFGNSRTIVTDRRRDSSDDDLRELELKTLLGNRCFTISKFYSFRIQVTTRM